VHRQEIIDRSNDVLDPADNLLTAVNRDCEKTLIARTGSVFFLMQSADGIIMSASSDYSIQIWKLVDGLCFWSFSYDDEEEFCEGQSLLSLTRKSCSEG
jgi:WD40 repeat protein